jgi:hypothetical protein
MYAALRRLHSLCCLVGGAFIAVALQVRGLQQRAGLVPREPLSLLLLVSVSSPTGTSPRATCMRAHTVSSNFFICFWPYCMFSYLAAVSPEFSGTVAFSVIPSLQLQVTKR